MFPLCVRVCVYVFFCDRTEMDVFSLISRSARSVDDTNNNITITHARARTHSYMRCLSLPLSACLVCCIICVAFSIVADRRSLLSPSSASET